MRCAKCGSDNPEGMKFCAACANPLAVMCPECGSVNTPSVKFCGNALHRVRSGIGAQQAAPSSGCTARLPERHSDELDGERKTVTALFADIKGSTELMEDLDPEEARAIIDPGAEADDRRGASL